MEDYQVITQRVEQEFACDHQGAVPHYRETGGTRGVWRQCLDCGEKLDRLSMRDFTEAQIARMPRFSEERDQRLWKAKSARRQELWEEMRGQRNAEWWAWYNSYLASEAWAAKRDAVFVRESRAQGRPDPRCQGCGRGAGAIAHHLTYAHVGQEFLFELILVCRPCHDRLHPERQEQSA